MTGVVEVCINGIWVSVCDLYPVDPIFLELVCHTLGYRGKNNYYWTIITIAGGRIIDSASGRYGYSSGLGVISSVNCSSCTDDDYCTIDDCQWSDSDDTQCLSHSRDAVVQCYNGIIVMISIYVIVLVL